MLHRLSNLVLKGSLLALIVTAVSVQGQEIQNIQLPVKVVQPPLAINLTEHPGKELAVIGVDENNQRSLVILVQDECCNDWKVFEQTPLERSWITFDYGEREDGGIESLYFLNRTSIHRYQPGVTESKFQFVQDVQSTYLVDEVDFIHRTRFIYDLNNDLKDDFALTGFQSLNVWLSDDLGGLQSHFLPIASTASVYSGRANGHVRFRPPNIEVIDVNNDEKDDVIHIKDGYLSLYLQNDKGFTLAGQRVETNEELYGSEWWLRDEEDGRQRSRGSLSYRHVMNLSDVNGDNTPDLIVLHTTASSVLSQSDNLEFYFGKMVEGKLSFDEQPSSVISNGETVNDIDLEDLDGDGTMEVQVSSLKLGLRKIVAALFSGNVAQDVYVFKLNEQGVYGKSPVTKEKVKMSFSFSEGTTGDPLKEFADFNGDGYKDLILSNGDDGIEVIEGTQGGAFERRGIEFDFTLPASSSNAQIDDLNKDGKDDIVFYYSRLDPKELHNQITIIKGE